MSTKLQKDDISVAILAGGKSSRMDGNNKGLMKLNNKLVLSRLISIACNYSSDVFVIASEITNKTFLRAIEIEDHETLIKPISSIESIDSMIGKTVELVGGS